MLRGGMHFGLWRWQYRIHKVPLVTVPQGKIGYVYARDGEPLPPSQTLGRVVALQQLPGRPRLPRRRADGRAESRSSASAAGSGRSCAKASTRSTSALFVVITEDAVYRLDIGRADASSKTLVGWQNELKRDRRLQPGRHRRPDRARRSAQPRASRSSVDSIGIVTVHDGPSLPPGEIIAPAVGNDRERHELPQQLPGPRGVPRRRRPPRPAVRPADRRHLLHQPLVRHGRDRSPRRSCRSATSAWSSATTAGSARTSPATAFRHGERVAEGERGVWERPLGPGQVSVQHLRRQDHPRADDQLRPALGHRQDRERTATTRACSRSTW